ncbi:MAG: hypothetical protein J7K15_01390 [Deltaproteobacteria bacterium]|nr:hypothetical protein [Deltaproteobacteria bacterium]
MTTLNKSDAKIFREMSMGGRFGKYGDAKRKTQFRKIHLKPPTLQQWREDKSLKESRKSKVGRGVKRGSR